MPFGSLPAQDTTCGEFIAQGVRIAKYSDRISESPGNLSRRELRQPERIADLLMQRQPQTVRLREKHFHHARVKLLAREFLNLGARSGNRQRLAVRTIGDHRVQRIRDREYSGSQQNLLAAQSARITGTVVTLLVRQHDLGGLLQKRN